MLKSNGTRLTTIPRHEIWMECQCGHSRSLSVADLLSLPNPPITVGEAVERVRCAKCEAKQVNEYRITYKGGSDDALREAE